MTPEEIREINYLNTEIIRHLFNNYIVHDSVPQALLMLVKENLSKLIHKSIEVINNEFLELLDISQKEIIVEALTKFGEID